MNTVYFASAGAWLSAMMEPGFGAGLKAGYNFYGIDALETAVPGLRIALGSWYLEPVLRGGCPCIWNAGPGFGRRL
ncbi:MAG: hypothetical protein LBG57_05250 [Treponema sp.]|jgi:hypothetical protein|nr:hypothetical protein [Treponema sp.]